MNSSALTKCPRTRARKVSKLSLSSRCLGGRMNIETPETGSQDRRLQGTSRLPKMRFKCEFKKGCASSAASSRCPRTLARKMSRQAKISIRSECLSGRGYRNAQDLWPGKCRGHKCPKPRPKFAAHSGADDGINVCHEFRRALVN